MDDYTESAFRKSMNDKDLDLLEKEICDQGNKNGATGHQSTPKKDLLGPVKQPFLPNFEIIFPKTRQYPD